MSEALLPRLTRNGDVEYRSVLLSDLDTRLDGPDITGSFAGYANLHGVTDTYGTRWLPGAWTAGGLDDKPYPLLWMHDDAHPVGVFVAREDERGLYIEGTFDQTIAGQEARARAQSGSAPELSVGFVRTETLAEDEDGIVSSKLVEVSQITLRRASSPGAVMEHVRKAEEAALATLAEDQRRARERARRRLILTP